MLKKCTQKIAERIIICLCVIVCMQLPFFITQYTHQLRGHIDELRWQVEQMRMVATFSGKNLDEYVAKFIKNSDVDFANQGLMMRAVVSRFEKLSDGWGRLKSSSALTRPFVFFRYLQPDIFSATFNDFKMGISFTFESIAFGLIGMFVGSGFCFLVGALFSRFTVGRGRRLSTIGPE